MNMLDQIIGLLAPHQCVRCGCEGALLCGPCNGTLPPAPMCCYKCKVPNAALLCSSCKRNTPLQGLRVATVYKGSAKQLIHALKFERARAAADAIGEILADTLTNDFTTISFVPTATSRIRGRGYDQARLVAVTVAKRLSCPFTPLLARVDQRRQLGQDREQRFKQAATSFRYIGDISAPTTVLLIDDVITTGASLESAASALRMAGVRRVYAATFAMA